MGGSLMLSSSIHKDLLQELTIVMAIICYVIDLMLLAAVYFTLW
jgi:hypothetical protein